MGSSDCLPTGCNFTFRLICFHFTDFFPVSDRLSPVPNRTLYTYRFPYTAGFLDGDPSSVHLPWSSLSLEKLDSLLPGCPDFFTILQNSLHVTVCILASPVSDRYITLPLSTPHFCDAPGLATRLLGDYRGGTFTRWCGPASLDAPGQEKRAVAKRLTSCNSPSGFQDSGRNHLVRLFRALARRDFLRATVFLCR